MAETSSMPYTIYGSRNSAEEQGNKACKQLAGRVIAGVAISLLWVTFTILILIYHLPEVFGAKVNSSVATDVGNKSNQSSIQSTCSPEPYTGEICRGALQMYQQCLVNGYGNNSDIHIPSDMDQERLEEQIQTLVSFLPLLNPTPQCVKEIVPLLCFYYLELCDSSGRRQQPSSEQCETIRNVTCSSEYAMAITLMGNEHQLPQCESLPATTVECKMATALGTADIQNSSSNNSDFQQVPVLTCREGFYETEKSGQRVCRPQCGEWKLYPRQLNSVVTSLLIVSTAIGLTAGIVVLVISCCDRKRMLKFPSIFIVYQSATFLVFTVMILIGLSFQEGLFCSSTDVTDSITNPTPYSRITAILFPYVYMQLLVWWLAHITVLFWGIRFPFHAKSFETSGKNKYLHLTAVLLGLFLPAVSTTIVGIDGDPILTRFPTIICSSGRIGTHFYSNLLPSGVLQMVGCTILVLIGWTLSQGRLSRLPKQQRVTVEVKVLINILYLISTTILLAITFSVSYIKSPNGAVGRLLAAYFMCESRGIQPKSPNNVNSCDRSQLDATVPVRLLFDVCFILLALGPLVNLTFAINVTKCKQILSKKSRYVFSSNASSSNAAMVEYVEQ